MYYKILIRCEANIENHGCCRKPTFNQFSGIANASVLTLMHMHRYRQWQTDAYYTETRATPCCVGSNSNNMHKCEKLGQLESLCKILCFARTLVTFVLMQDYVRSKYKCWKLTLAVNGIKDSLQYPSEAYQRCLRRESLNVQNPAQLTAIRTSFRWWSSIQKQKCFVKRKTNILELLCLLALV